MTEKELGIYIHIPFCIKKCDYCDFISYPNQLEKQDEYTEKIVEEIKAEKEILQNYRITTIYFGGGTPSSLDSKNIIKILNAIDELIQIKTKSEMEITIEVNPGTVTKQKLGDYKKAGINRLSIGLQSTKNELLKLIGRIHTYEDFEKSYKMAREVGFENINVDLMLGLPNQTIEDIKNSIRKIENLQPEHVSTYSLILEENTEITKKIEQGILKLPDEEKERNEYWYVKNKLELLGYRHYEISNFAKPGKESKHNLNCWNQKEYLGFGVAAHSYINQVRYSNCIQLGKYLKITQEELNKLSSKNLKFKIKTNRVNELPITIGYRTIQEIQNKKDQEREFMLLSLRKIEGVSIQKFKEKFGENPIYLFHKELEKLVQEELIEIDLDKIRLTNKGLDFANIVWEEFV